MQTEAAVTFFPEETTMPIQRMRNSAFQLQNAFLMLIKGVDSDLAGKVASFFRAKAGDQAAMSSLGFSNMSALSAMMSPELNIGVEEPQVALTTTINIFNNYFIVEKFTDDFGVMSPDGTFAYPDILRNINATALEVLEQPAGALCDKIIFGRLQGIDWDPIDHADRQTEGATLLASMGVDSNQSPNMQLAALNLVALAQLKDRLQMLGRDNPDLQDLADKAIGALKRRYQGSNDQVDNPRIAIEGNRGAMRVAEDTILTDVFAGLILAQADAYRRTGTSESLAIYERYKQVQPQILEALSMHTQAIRLLNDAGPIVSDSKRTRRYLAMARTAIDPNQQLTPQEFFAALDAKLGEKYEKSKTRKTYLGDRLSRVLKDNREREYNLALFAGYDPNLPATEQWQAFNQNVEFMGQTYEQTIRRLDLLAEDLRQLCPPAAYWITNFVGFNLELYRRMHGDYDRTVAWSDLKTMTTKPTDRIALTEV